MQEAAGRSKDAGRKDDMHIRTPDGDGRSMQELASLVSRRRERDDADAADDCVKRRRCHVTRSGRR